MDNKDAKHTPTCDTHGLPHLILPTHSVNGGNIDYGCHLCTWDLLDGQRIFSKAQSAAAAIKDAERNALVAALDELVRETESILDLHPGISQWQIRSTLQTADAALKLAKGA